MITHFADLELTTVSLEGVKQCYANRLQLPIIYESNDFIRFQLTSFTTLSFRETYESVPPAHFAFQVPYSKFDEVAAFVQQSGLLILKQELGQYIDETNGRKNLYFRDGDGHLLEIIAHDFIKEDVINTTGKLRTLYIREIGFPVDNVPTFRDWLKKDFGMKTVNESDLFNFVISGTAHAIVVSKQRPWIPIAMKALPPKMVVTFGTPELEFIKNLSKNMDNSLLKEKKLLITKDDYTFWIEHTPDFTASLAESLNLPNVSSG
ncbi:glyoxalase/bleomycin resistance/dioxygenase family protein [Peribacillus sp. FSL E2-0218]|uniref:glyoxalase/bleomycin resistance/dioxygenase family protein n=1 Tax=Peribacillus sp. FSL E2-0218 TaxID=2921364 RepID=UPI0030EEB7FF